MNGGEIIYDDGFELLLVTLPDTRHSAASVSEDDVLK